ncbi:MFS transporter [Campylobacter sp. 19-13652]|uniref:MFS transporter n=1 Tax=Campylobacter sp. 19-13652 TaxID=2840180 RepID=UPI001C77FAF7|nr:MFS transporter [Campylobacter sp. 19-13652]BCX79854.1 MFS transporter [Campylobacter sp. 19-13652]
MSAYERAVVYFSTVLITATMYAPQPIAPLLGQVLGVSSASVALFITAIMAPLAISALFYGYFLEKFSITRTLIFAFFALGILQFGFAFSHNYTIMLNIRGIQGLFIPAAMTGLMSYISSRLNGVALAQGIGVYIGMTIIGGFLGRLLSGWLSDIYGYELFMSVLAFLLLLSSIFLSTLDKIAIKHKRELRLSDILSVLLKRTNLYAYICIFCLFFSFLAILSFAPFELTNRAGGYSGLKNGVLYVGFLLGVFISFFSSWFLNLLGGVSRVLWVVAMLFMLGLLLCFFDGFALLLSGMIVICAANFLAHSILSGFVASFNEKKAIASGLYVSFYYAGGVFGSFVPAFAYEYGWGVFLLFLAFVCLVGLGFGVRLKDA